MHWNWLIFFEQSVTDEGPYWQLLLSGLGWTVATALSGWVIALILGSLVGVARTVPTRWISVAANAYVELFRNIPLVVQMFLWFYVIPELLPHGVATWIKGLEHGAFVTAVLSLGTFTSARVAEQVRSGIQSLPRGQRMAGLAMGLTLPQTYRYVLLPMAFRIIIPPLTSEFMNIFKNSAVALTISVIELTFQMRQMIELTNQVIEVITVTTFLYLMVAFSVNRLMAWIERRSQVPGFIAGGK